MKKQEKIDLTCAYLAQAGYEIVGTGVRPCARDERCEIDVVARDPKKNAVIFFEVRACEKRANRKRSAAIADRRKRNILLRACTNWILKNRWHGNFRFDVIECYDGEKPEIDHVVNVPLFPPKWRFW